MIEFDVFDDVTFDYNQIKWLLDTLSIDIRDVHHLLAWTTLDKIQADTDQSDWWVDRLWMWSDNHYPLTIDGGLDFVRQQEQEFLREQQKVKAPSEYPYGITRNQRIKVPEDITMRGLRDKLIIEETQTPDE